MTGEIQAPQSPTAGDVKLTLTLPFELDMPNPRQLEADNENLAAAGRRVIVRRDCNNGKVEIFVAPKGLLVSGFVVAVEEVPPPPLSNLRWNT